jgi:hypothetical protein
MRTYQQNFYRYFYEQWQAPVSLTTVLQYGTDTDKNTLVINDAHP